MDTPLDNLQNLIFDIRGKVSDGENLELNNTMLEVHENDQYLRNELSDLRNELSDLRKRKQQLEEADRKNKRLKLSEERLKLFEEDRDSVLAFLKKTKDTG